MDLSTIIMSVVLFVLTLGLIIKIIKEMLWSSQDK